MCECFLVLAVWLASTVSHLQAISPGKENIEKFATTRSSSAGGADCSRAEIEMYCALLVSDCFCSRIFAEDIDKSIRWHQVCLSAFRFVNVNNFVYSWLRSWHYNRVTCRNVEVGRWIEISSLHLHNTHTLAPFSLTKDILCNYPEMLLFLWKFHNGR